jgi:hypothetical protein
MSCAKATMVAHKAHATCTAAQATVTMLHNKAHATMECFNFVWKARLLLESGGFLLKEDGGYLLVEE